MDWKRIPSLSALRAFEAAVRHKSLSKAAQELNVTHAAIAQHVRGLEADFNETLLTRRGRGVAPTPMGQQLAEELGAGFETIAEGVEGIRSLTEQRPLNITLTPTFAAHWLMPRIGRFWRDHPDISININPSNNLVDLRRDGFDLGIRYGDGEWTGLDAEMLTDGEFWVVAHPDHVREPRTGCIDDVADQPWVFESSMLERKAIVEREGIDFSDANVTLLNTNDLVISATRAGLGVCVQPRSLVEHLTATGELMKICELKQDDLGYYMITLPGRHHSGLGTFIKWLREQASEIRA